MFITLIDNIGIPKHKKHLWRLSLGMKLFYYLWVKRFFDIRKEIHLTFPSAPKPRAHPTQCHWPGFGEQAKVNLLLPSQELNLLTFFKIPQIHRTRFWCMMSFTSPGQISIWDFYFDISEWLIVPACAWMPAFMFAPN